MSFLLLGKLASKPKEYYLPLGKGILAVAKGATPDPDWWKCAHPSPNSSVHIIINIFIILVVSSAIWELYHGESFTTLTLN